MYKTKATKELKLRILDNGRDIGEGILTIRVMPYDKDIITMPIRIEFSIQDPETNEPLIVQEEIIADTWDYIHLEDFKNFFDIRLEC